MPKVQGCGESRRLRVRLQPEGKSGAGVGTAHSRRRFSHRSSCGVGTTMSRSVRGRPSNRGNASIREEGLRSNCASARDRYDSIRVIGAPIAVTLPRLKDIRPRYCSRSDDRPAAVLALSMLRLNIAQLGDWNGSAVDFAGKALARFCRSHGLDTVSRVFEESSIRILDEILEQSEYDRQRFRRPRTEFTNVLDGGLRSVGHGPGRAYAFIATWMGQELAGRVLPGVGNESTTLDARVRRYGC